MGSVGLRALRRSDVELGEDVLLERRLERSVRDDYEVARAPREPERLLEEPPGWGCWDRREPSLASLRSLNEKAWAGVRVAHPRRLRRGE